MKKRVWWTLGALLAYVGLPYALVQVGNLGVVRRGRSPGTGIALTFDDGPDPSTTPRVLDALREAGVHATFFMLGEAAERHPDLVRQIAAEGHEVASHGYAHRHAWTRAPWSVGADLRRSLKVLRGLTGQDIAFFRPPHGAYTLATVLTLRFQAAQRGVRGAHWTVEAHDWHPGYTASGVTRRVLDSVEAGGVIVMHDAGRGGETAAQALPELLPELRKRGYAPTTLSGLEGVRPERAHDLLPRALKLLDRWFDRTGNVVRFGIKANSLLRAGLVKFPLPDHPQFAHGAPLLELHVNSERMTQFAPKPLTGIRMTRESLKELARAVQERPEWAGAQGVFAIGPFSDILGALGFEAADVPPAMRRRLGTWANMLRRAYGAVGEGHAHDVRVATISREELLRRYGAR
ncbi:polysaccharide deacetylase family protein [Deinococcus peraridilitoris]|uniref:Putative xylanase/chitin deacetylase n=1 Tax=Deinococcus peraridilitoris (strain DSM 19664 / LMG 22246 / CIP 109416 / KR-200) TaxID=937777 RepID=L0A1E8_DEIPD|nr:polysaccharide deacetylase family protein [Deinococcus peraridilitoris]AFZ67279.1 putative xylanase/chitin deacetylase [Deinococcus peraridilitoris DSM 19664]